MVIVVVIGIVNKIMIGHALLISEDPLGPTAASLLSYNLKTPALIMYIFL